MVTRVPVLRDQKMVAVAILIVLAASAVVVQVTGVYVNGTNAKFVPPAHFPFTPLAPAPG